MALADQLEEQVARVPSTAEWHDVTADGARRDATRHSGADGVDDAVDRGRAFDRPHVERLGASDDLESAWAPRERRAGGQGADVTEGRVGLEVVADRRERSERVEVQRARHAGVEDARERRRDRDAVVRRGVEERMRTEPVARDRQRVAVPAPLDPRPRGRRAGTLDAMAEQGLGLALDLDPGTADARTERTPPWSAGDPGIETMVAGRLPTDADDSAMPCAATSFRCEATPASSP